MNLELFNIATKTAAAIGSSVVKEDRNAANKYGVEFVALSDEELKAKCIAAIEGRDVEVAPKDETLLTAILSNLAWFRRRANSLTVKRIALAIEAFRRVPADLPVGSALYPQQVQAAISLTNRCLIQMNTGEGKTYALLPAAFALACEYHRVYIVCANDYLAWRDASRTRTFWEFVGLSQGLCLSSDDQDWSSRIIYTTLAGLMVKQMHDVNQPEQPAAPISFGAVLLDEADAILLDEGTRPFTLVQLVKPEAFDWSFALDYAGTLTEGEEVETDYSRLNTSLTIKGESRLRETLVGYQHAGYLLTRLAVELAYVALKVATENTHYIIEGTKVLPVNPITGKVEPDYVPSWIIPLEVEKGFPARPENITLDSLNPLTLLKKFKHLSGLSGTVADDALQYLFLYLLPTLIIEPRKKRHDGIQRDVLYRTRGEAYEGLFQEVSKATSAGRPVLIGTQTIVDAENIYAILSAKIKDGQPPKLLTGKSEQQTAEVLKLAGEVGSIVVATQLAGRGIDIRLSPEARTNGGLALFGLGHSWTIRHDKQFLGRAGRQGDPFTARFICSYEDELLSSFIGEKTDRLMKRLGQDRGVSIESSMVTKRITGIQNNHRRYLFWQNQQQSLLNASSYEIRQHLEHWFGYLQLPNAEHQSECSEEFVEWAISFYANSVLPETLPSRKISTGEAERLTRSLNSSLGLSGVDAFLETDFEEQEVQNATSILKKLLARKIKAATEMGRRLRSLPLEAFANASEKGIDLNGDRTLEEDPILSEEDYRIYQKTRDRTQRKIAFWSIRSKWMAFIQTRSRINFRADQRRLSYLESYRIVTDQVSREWQVAEKEIATTVLHNLLRSATPFDLDKLFVYMDNSLSPQEKKPSQFAWEQGRRTGAETLDPKKDIHVLISQFVAQSAGEMNKEFESSNLRRLLFDFAEQNPIYLLQGPAQIRDALDRWTETEKERGFNTKLRKIHARWLQKFLFFLRERKLIGSLPTLRSRLKSTFQKFAKTVTETRTAVATVGVLAFLLFFVLATHWGHVGQAKSLGPFAAAIDQIFFAGLLAQGSITAPAFGILYLSFLITVFLFPQSANSPKQAIPFMRVLAHVLRIVFAWWLTDWHYGQMTLPSIVRSLSVFVAIFFVAMITQRIVFLLEDTVGLSLLAGNLCYGLSIVFLPTLLSTQPNKWTLLLFVAAIIGLYYVWQRYNGEEIELVSALLTNSASSMRAEEIVGTLKVEADCGVSPHVYAILCAWLLYETLTSAPISSRVSITPRILLLATITTYIVVMAGRVAYMISRRLSREMWQIDLNQRHQIIKDTYTVSDLTGKLSQIKRRLLTRELCFQLVILLSAVFLMKSATFPRTYFPFSLVLVFAVFLLAVSLRSFGLQLYKLLYNRMPLDIEVLDFASTAAESEKHSPWHKTLHLAHRVLGVLTAAYTIFEVLTQAHEMLVKLKIVR